MTPADLADALRQPGAVLLDAPRPDADTGRRGAVLFSRPERSAAATEPADVRPLLGALDAALAEGRWVAGALAYEAGYALEPERFPDPPAPADVPLGWFGVYGPPTAVPAGVLAEVLGAVARPVLRDVRFALDEQTYGARVGRIRDRIREGDVYQVNLTAPFSFGLDGDPLGLYAALRGRQSVAYGAFLRLPDEVGGAAVASVSPELFFRVDSADGERTVTARPMKGTAPPDAGGAASLVASEKDRAENLMIVDLLRNDLARVAESGSVRVPTLFEAERYETVTQMTSTVRGVLRPEAGLADVLGALFPCGSVTGAPKIRAMQVIREVEDTPRGVYCGAIGYAAPRASGLGTAAFSVPIRTAVIASRNRYDVGSGIVWDSRAEAEYAECLLKAQVLTDLAS